MAETQLAYVATQTMLASLHDSHTYYMPPAAWQEYRRRLTGNPGVTGIGVSISSRMDASGIRWIFVEDVFPGSPAESAGIKRFDRIVQVGATPLRNATAEQASELLRGVAGSVADVTVQRGDQTLKIAVSRAAYQIKSVDAKLIEPGVAYVHLYDFRDRGANDVSAALSTLNAQTPLRAIVLDLRGNSGGLLAEAAALASLFLPSGTPLAKVTERNATGMLQSAGAPPFGNVPLALLVDGRSASASEIVTGALKDTRRATIVGERTAGALGGALTVALPEGGMSVTALRIVTPSGAQVEGVGIAPHTQVALTESDMERGEDTQLRAALQALIALRTAHLVLAA
jgi:carboxyl-terminal processing protease